MPFRSRGTSAAGAAGKTHGGEAVMRKGIHPEYQVTTIVCACGHTFLTRSTKKDMRVELCSNCHPFFTGKQKLIDTAGRVERFQRRYAGAEKKAERRQKGRA